MTNLNGSAPFNVAKETLRSCALAAQVLQAIGILRAKLDAQEREVVASMLVAAGVSERDPFTDALRAMLTEQALAGAAGGGE